MFFCLLRNSNGFIAFIKKGNGWCTCDEYKFSSSVGCMHTDACSFGLEHCGFHVEMASECAMDVDEAIVLVTRRLPGTKTGLYSVRDTSSGRYGMVHTRMSGTIVCDIHSNWCQHRSILKAVCF